MSLSLGDVFDIVARHVEPHAPAVVCDGVVTDWGRFDRASNALARRLLAAGLGVQSKVGLYMRNGPDHLIAFAACVKARLCPFNINFRYGPAEIGYLIDNADCEALVFDSEFAPVVKATPGAAALRLRLAARGEARGAESLAAACSGRDDPLGIERDPGDIVLLYTGGTTGMPKGVMWPSGAMWDNLAPGLAIPGREAPTTPERLAVQVRSGEGRFRIYVAPPLMHGAGLVSALGVLFRGGSVALTGRAHFDAERTVGELAELGCDGVVIVGEAFARPILDVLRAAPGRHDLRRLRGIVSSGMMWSAETKRALLELLPDAVLVDTLSASEAPGLASSIAHRGSPAGEARFDLSGAVVLRPDDLTPVRPGSGEVGVIAKAGILPLGYYKDPERTARTYVTIGGVRHVVGGDHATVEADGSIRLLGRGSHCINTGGEKVYPEEVEEALKTHPAVRDALVLGVPDPLLGQSIAAVVSHGPPVEAAVLVAHVQSRLARYKAPRDIVFVPEVPRGPSGKADYPEARRLFEQAARPQQASA